MGVHMRSLPDADRGIPKGGVAPVNGRVPRSGNTVPAAVSQLQENQPYTEALARTSKRRFGAHAPRCLMCTCRSAPALADPRSKSTSTEASRTPCRDALDGHSGLENREACRDPTTTTDQRIGPGLGSRLSPAR